MGGGGRTLHLPHVLWPAKGSGYIIDDDSIGGRTCVCCRSIPCVLPTLVAQNSSTINAAGRVRGKGKVCVRATVRPWCEGVSLTLPHPHGACTLCRTALARSATPASEWCAEAMSAANLKVWHAELAGTRHAARRRGAPEQVAEAGPDHSYLGRSRRVSCPGFAACPRSRGCASRACSAGRRSHADRRPQYERLVRVRLWRLASPPVLRPAWALVRRAWFWSRGARVDTAAGRVRDVWADSVPSRQRRASHAWGALAPQIPLGMLALM